MPATNDNRELAARVGLDSQMRSKAYIALEDQLEVLMGLRHGRPEPTAELLTVLWSIAFGQNPGA